MKIENTKFTIFRNRREDNGETVQAVTFNSLISSIKSDNREGVITNFRKLFVYLDKPESYNAYNKIPRLCTASEYYRNKAGERVFRAYNGVVSVVIDDLSTSLEIEKAKKQVAQMPQVLAALMGADGHSVVVFTVASLPDGTLPKTEEAATLFHTQAYMTSVQCLAPQTEFHISIQQPALDTTCLMTVDERPYVNPYPTPFIIQQPTEVTLKLNKEKPFGQEALKRMKPGAEQLFTYSKTFNAAYSRALNELQWIETDRAEALWVRVADICFEAGLPEEEATIRLSHHFAKYDIEDIRACVCNAYNTHKHIKTKIPANKHQIVALRLKEFLDRRYDIRFNEVMQMTEFRERHSFRFMFRELNKREMNTIFLEAQLEGIAPTLGEVDAIIHSTVVPRYNPIEDYLNDLPTWDGKDHMTELARMVPTDNPHWERLFKQWFLSMVAHWMNGDEQHANSTAPILIGAQGYRKSTFCRQLLPPELQTFYTDSIDCRSNQEAERALSRFLIINIDEFDQLTDKQFAFVKHLFQKPVTNIRRMYSETIGSQRRYASFIGTTNTDEVLRDPTGNRRYLCANITDVIKTDQPIDYKQLYAQAVHLITSGVRYWLDDEDERLIRETNSRFEIQTPLEEHFLTCFAPCSNEADGIWMRSTEILEALFSLPTFNKNTENDSRKLGHILRKFNVRKERKVNGFVYLVKRVGS